MKYLIIVFLLWATYAQDRNDILDDKAQIISWLNQDQPQFDRLTCPQLYQTLVQPDIIWDNRQPMTQVMRWVSENTQWSINLASTVPDIVSSTNKQVAWFDESDTVKIIGNNILYIKEWALYHYKASPLQRINRIALPVWLSNPKLLNEWNMVIIQWSLYQDVTDQSVYDSASQILILQYQLSATLQPVRAYRLQWSLIDTRLGAWRLIVARSQTPNFIQSWSKIENFGRNLWASLIYDTVWNKISGTIWCDQVHALSTWSSQVSTITTIDMLTWKIVDQKAILWDIQHMYIDRAWVIAAMSLESWSCPINARCAPHQNSAIVQIWSWVSATKIIWNVPWQYALRRSNNKTIIVSTDRKNSARTHVRSLQSGIIDDVILDIAPRESFQSARLIGTKLYLVTFEKTDPLFVIDVSKKLTIMWELVIPWFSSYLHAYAPEQWGIQRLVWLGQWPVSWDAMWVKLDLYEINFNQIINNKISVKQLSSVRVWWAGTTTPALYDPRTFMRNDVTKQLYLPISRISSNMIRCFTTPCPSNEKMLFHGYKIYWISSNSIRTVADVDLTKNLTLSNLQQMHYGPMRIWFVWSTTYFVNDISIVAINKNRTVLDHK